MITIQVYPKSYICFNFCLRANSTATHQTSLQRNLFRDYFVVVRTFIPHPHTDRIYKERITKYYL